MFRLRDAGQDMIDLLMELNLIDLNTYDYHELEQMLIKFMKGRGLRPNVIEVNKNTEDWQALPHAF